MPERVSVIDPEYARERLFRTFFADGLLGSATDQLRKHPGITFEGKDKTPPEDLERLLKAGGDQTIDALVVRSATKLKGPLQHLLDETSGLSLVIRAGIGTDNIDSDHTAGKGLIVENTPQGNIDAVIAKTLADIEYISSMQFEGSVALANGITEKVKWDEKPEAFRGKVFGVVGLGNIGRRVAIEIQKRGGEVIGYDPYVQPEGVENASLEELCRRSDLITVHAALTESSDNMIGSNQFRLMKNGIVIINNARGGIVNEEALLQQLAEGQIKAAVLDVFSIEGKALRDDEALAKLKPNEQERVRTVLRPLLDHPRVVKTMHSAANSRQAQTKNGIDTAAQLVAYADGRGIMNGINFPSVNLTDGLKIPGTSYRLLVLNDNVPGVHASVANAIRGVHEGYNVEAGMTYPSRDGRRAALVEEVTFRRGADHDIEAIPLSMAQKMIEVSRAIAHVLGVRMVRIDRK
jgi:D-3-phosphoglycerate dehydrogenase